MAQSVEQAVVVEQSALNPHLSTTKLAIFNADGTARPIPNKAAAQSDAAALTSAQITGGQDPTEAEYNALQADVAALRTVVNSLLAKLRTAGVIAT